MSPQIIVFALIGAAIGAFIIGEKGVVFGLVIGWLVGRVVELRKQVDALEKRVSAAEPRPEKAGETITRKPDALKAGLANMKPVSAPVSVQTAPVSAPTHSKVPPTPSTPAGPSPVHSDSFGSLLTFVRDFFTRGNVVVRIGLIVLFFGVAFLVKYAAEHQMIPIELRLTAIALGGIVMLIFGWRLRTRKENYALLIQGGAVGILYLTIFGAARLYGLVPLGLAFFLMVGVVGLSALLAVLQNSAALAAFGAIGGFIAPVLVSTGTGSHVALFSYYALINAGILGISWFKSWRILNWIGFVFTFGIGMTWGYRYYTAEFFSSTEPFLILFFLFYAAISVLFAHRQPVYLKGYIDGSLVFGLPLIAFGLQSAMVVKYEYGMAFSALALGGFYIGLASALWRRQVEGMRLLTESFLALGVAFASIAIPLGLDSEWTTGLWCFEGAGLVWIGMRQNRLLARTSGLLLQFGAGLAFIDTMGSAAPGLPVLNGATMSCLIISISAFISNYFHQRFRERLKTWEQLFPVGVLIWGVLWWFGGGVHEIDRLLDGNNAVFAAVVFLALSGWTAGWFSRWLSWQEIGYPAIFAFPVVTLVALLLFSNGLNHPFDNWGGAAWGISAFSGYHLLSMFDRKWPHLIARGLHLNMFYLLVFLMTWESAWVVGRIVEGSTIWRFSAWGLLPSLTVIALLRFGPRISWPVRRFESGYLGEGLIPVVLFAWGWIITACFREGNPAPLSYFPVINPVELVQLFAFGVLIRWKIESGLRIKTVTSELPPHSLTWLLSATAFLWLNAVIARTVHFYRDVPFSAGALFDSVHFQSALSIAWTLTAMIIMGAATRRQSRQAWFVGAVLLGVVVAKLFLVDLAGIGTVARIITFLAVGVLMLVIGYVSPLPPKPLEDTE